MQIRPKEIVGFLIASRVPNLIIIGYVQFATAYFLMRKHLDQILTIDFGLLILSTTMIGSAGYVINDYFDQKIDMVNRPDKVIIGPTLRRRLAILIHFLLTVGGIFLGLIIDPLIATVHFCSSLALLLYSSTLKRILLIDTLTISILSSLTLLIVLVFFNDFRLLVIAYALFGGTAVFIRESIKDLISTKGDQVHGVNSIASIWGIRGAKIIIYLACTFGVVMLSYYLYSVPNWNIRYFFMGMFLFIAWFVYRLSLADKKKDFMELKFYVDLIIIAGLISIIFS